MKKMVWIVGAVVLVLAAIFFWIYFFNWFGASFCERTNIGANFSPDEKKTVVVFMDNCGPTVGLSIHASVMASGEADNNGPGNALRINSNQGRAWPRDNQGRPIIRAVWQSPTSVILQYSSNSEIFYQKSEVDGVRITFEEIAR